MFRQSNSPTYNKNRGNTNNHHDNYNRSNNYRRNTRNNQNNSIRTTRRRDTNPPEEGGWETVSRQGSQRHQTYQKRQWQPRPPTNSRFNSLKPSPTSSSRSYAKTNSFSALDDTVSEPSRTRWGTQQPQHQQHTHQQQQQQQPQHQQQQQR